MKTIIFLIGCSIFTLFSCSEIDIEALEDNEIEATSSTFNKSTNGGKPKNRPKNKPIYSSNEIIVEYALGLTEADKDSIRTYYAVGSYQVCSSCMDEGIEKWRFNNLPNGVTIENKLGSIEPDEPIAEGIINADLEFHFYYENENYVLEGGSLVPNYYSKIVNNTNNVVTIAVLDTGVDVNYPVFSKGKFLRNGSGDTISEVYSGWDFVNNDDNCYDDNEQLHGTIVSSIVSNALDDLNIPHQILPVKVSNALGGASYFDILCGLAFSLPRAEIVNISFGWYDTGGENFANDIFSSLIKAYEKETLVVTSAGNNMNNNDGFQDGMFHYPSNYTSSNVLAIAASYTDNQDNTDIAYFSNFGEGTVDFFAPGQHIPFGGTHINGTSFSAPVVSAVAAQLLHESGMVFLPIELINALNYYGQYHPFSKPTQYSKLIELP